MRSAVRMTVGALAIAGIACSLAGVPAWGASTNTPIKHLVVIFQENVSFDHYFATYPVAANPPGEPGFKAGGGHAVGERLERESFVQ